MTRQGVHGYTDQAKGQHHHAIGCWFDSGTHRPYSFVAPFRFLALLNESLAGWGLFKKTFLAYKNRVWHATGCRPALSACYQRTYVNSKKF